MWISLNSERHACILLQLFYSRENMTNESKESTVCLPQARLYNFANCGADSSCCNSSYLRAEGLLQDAGAAILGKFGANGACGGALEAAGDVCKMSNYSQFKA